MRILATVSNFWGSSECKEDSWLVHWASCVGALTGNIAANLTRQRRPLSWQVPHWDPSTVFYLQFRLDDIVQLIPFDCSRGSMPRDIVCYLPHSLQRNIRTSDLSRGCWRGYIVPSHIVKLLYTCISSVFYSYNVCSINDFSKHSPNLDPVESSNCFC